MSALIGTEIYNQLRMLGQQDLWAWGARNFKVFSEKYFQGEEKEWHLGGIFFQVNGLLHKQKVMVRLQGNDLYHVEIGNIVKGQWVKRKNTEAVTNVYFDMLIDVIDEMVEGTKNKSPEEARKMYDEAGAFYI